MKASYKRTHKTAVSCSSYLINHTSYFAARVLKTKLTLARDRSGKIVHKQIRMSLDCRLGKDPVVIYSQWTPERPGDSRDELRDMRFRRREVDRTRPR